MLLTKFLDATKMQNERDSITTEGMALGTLKEQALQTYQVLPKDYSIRLLKLIARIARHDLTYRDQYGAERATKRRANLGNLAITAKLFRDQANLISWHPENHYTSRIKDYIGHNIFSNLAFLHLFDICQYTTPLNRPIYHMDDAEVSNVLDNICQSFEEIALKEIQNYQRPNPGLFARTVNFTRRQYSKPTRLPALFVLTAFHRENTHIGSAISAIQQISTLQLGPPLIQNQVLTQARAVLRCMTIIGEAFTQINLSPQSKSLSDLSQQDFQLFKKIRDKLADSEKDIHANNIENYIQNQNIIPIQLELMLLLPSLQTLQQQLQIVPRHVHYMNPALAPAAHYMPTGQLVHTERFPNIRHFLNSMPQNNSSLAQDRVNFPAEFMPEAMVGHIQTEIDALRDLIKDCPGQSTLEDPHEEDKHAILNEGQPSFIQLVLNINHAHHNDLKLNQSIQIILAHAPVRDGHRVIEVPCGVISNQTQHSMTIHLSEAFVQNNFLNIANALKQYATQLQFIHHLSLNPCLRLILEYHIGRLVKFLNQIPMLQRLPFMQGMPEPEIRAFRNAIQHDNHETDLVGLSADAFMCHYLAPIIRVLPTLLQHLVPPVHFVVP